MANPFTSPELSGFNSSPPPNDGSPITANQLDWDVHHIGKIGTPLKNYIDDLVTNTNLAFATVDDASKLTRGILPDSRLSPNVRTGTVAIANGGTGATTAAAARGNLGLGAIALLDTIDNDNWGFDDLSIANGGTGASSASAARDNLGLGALATLDEIDNANWGFDDLAIANGGTGASTASDARDNLGLGSIATLKGGWARIASNGSIIDSDGTVVVGATQTAAGVYEITLSGFTSINSFSCVATVDDSAGGVAYNATVNVTSATRVQIGIMEVDGSAPSLDSHPFHLICLGS